MTLIDALEIYRAIPTKLPRIPYTRNFSGLKFGDVDRKIAKIKERLAMEGDYPKESGAIYSDIFDEKLKSAIYRYKERFNLEQNGIIDKVTYILFE